MEKQEDSIQSRELSKVEVLRAGGSPTDVGGGGDTSRETLQP